MSLFEFSDISKSEETIQRTWEDFRSALATGVFSYNELDAAKANTTFLKVFDDLFSHCHPFFDISAESILACPTTLMRAGRLRPADPEPTYSRFIPNKDYITKHNRFSPPGVEWLYLAIGDPCVAETCALKECRAEAGELFGLCQFKLNEDYSEKTLVNLTIAEDVLYEDLNRQLENSADEIRNREVKKAVDSIMRKGYAKTPDVSDIKEKFTRWAAYTYAAEQKSTIVVSEWWWLRSPSSCVSRSGLVSSRDIVTNTIMVRPAIWVDIASVIDASKLLPNDSTDASQGESSGASQEESDDQSENIKIGDVSIGDTVFIGKYEQDNDLTNGKEPIEWIVLKKTDDKRALLISKYALDRKQFNVSDSNVDWTSSSLYKWLNGEFMDEAFGKNEKSLIVDDENNRGCVFVLGMNETVYIHSELIEYTTKYAEAKPGWSGELELEWEWMSDNIHGNVFFTSGGDVWFESVSVAETCSVRPAMWVRLY